MINLTDKELSSYLSNLNNMERSTVIVGGNQNYGGSSRLEIYEMLVRHELKIFSNLNGMSTNTGNILYGFAWSKSRASDIYLDLH